MLSRLTSSIMRLPSLSFLLLPFIRMGSCDDDKDDATKITAAFIDPATGIPMQRFFGAASGFGFGIAIPDGANSSSFIGQLTFPLSNSAGWGAFSLTGDMEGPLLMAAWASADNTRIFSSFRQAANEDDNPPEVTGTFTARPIAEATSVNSTFLTYTFLCKECLSAQFGLAPGDTTGTVEMGWALGSKAVGNPDTPAALLNFHDVGFGGFQAQLASAKIPQSQFDGFAALAGQPVQPATGAVQFGAQGGGTEDDDSDHDSGDEDD